MRLVILRLALIGLLPAGGAAAAAQPAPLGRPLVHLWLLYDSYCNVCVRGMNTIVLGILARYDATS